MLSRLTVILLLCCSLTDVATGHTDAEKLQVLQQYAPRVWMARGEQYFPSSVEWAFPQMKRVKRGGSYWLYAKQELSSPSDDSLPLFKGNLQSAPVYAFWVEKPASELEQQLIDQGLRDTATVVDLVYFFYYPYNRGKEIADTIWGNHVSDWEHITVRLREKVVEDVPRLVPDQVYISAHDFGGAHEWSQVAKVVPTELERQILGIEGTEHPVIYSAWGSHGCWAQPGSHDYKDLGILGDLTDHCSEGLPWNTWQKVEGYDFVRKKSLSGGEWPRWMGSDFSAPGPGPDPSDPASGAIFRWGNGEWNGNDAAALISSVGGESRLNDGPTGPISKGVWNPDPRVFQ
ncbi:MAG: Vps62-related protein [Planctomycetota bacterium]